MLEVKDAIKEDLFKVQCNNLSFSFSGVQNKVTDYYHAGNSKADTAAFALRSVIHGVFQVTLQAQKQYPGLPVVFSGGVASNSMLREKLAPLSPIFSQPQFSTDNAMGVAVLAARIGEG